MGRLIVDHQDVRGSCHLSFSRDRSVRESQRESATCPAACHGALQADFAPMIFDDFMYDGQSQPGALFIGGKKGVENFGTVRRGIPGPSSSTQNSSHLPSRARPAPVVIVPPLSTACSALRIKLSRAWVT